MNWIRRLELVMEGLLAFVDAFSHRTGGAILATRQGFSVALLPSNISTGT
jgi:hypothetical protein